MKRELYREQVRHSGQLLGSLLTHKHALDASETGCGKTLVAAELASMLRRPTFVVCPKVSRPMWEKEMIARDASALAIINYEKLRTGKTMWGTWEQGRHWKWNLPNSALVIWDEVQNCQGVSSLNSKMLIAAKPFMNLALSATAAEDPIDLRALGYILGLHTLRNYWSWAKANGCVPNPWGGLEFEDEDHVHLNNIHNHIFPLHGSRLTVQDLQAHFQDSQVITTPLEFGDGIKKIYKEMEKEVAELAKIMTSDSDHPAAAALIAKLRARQQVEFCKVPAIIEMAESFLEEGRSVVIFVNFNETINALLKRLPQAKVIRGGQSDKEREDAEVTFQDNSCRLLIVNSQAGGVSLSLHDLHGGHPRAGIVSPDWNPKKILQVLGRLPRAGGKTPTQQHVLFAAGTVEEEVEKVMSEKIARIVTINEGKNNLKNIVDANVDLGDGARTVSETVSQLSDDPNQTLPETVTSVPPVATQEEVKEVYSEGLQVGIELGKKLAEPAHATWAPSSLGMFERCCGFRNRKTEAGDSEAADRGTRIHKALEKGNLDDLADEKEKFLAQVCKDFIDSKLVEFGIPDKDFREIRLKINLSGGLTTFGTADRLLVYKRKGLMFDYKSGYRLVEDAEENAQAWSYVVGAFQKESLGLDELDFYFLIPNRDQISFAHFTRDDLPKMKLRLNTIIRRAQAAEPAQYSPQPELCEYCSRQATCPALGEKFISLAAALRPGLPVPQNPNVSIKRPDDIPHLLRLAPLMETWAQGVRAEALRLQMETGLEIEGFVRQERATARAVTSVFQTWDLVREKFDVPLPEFLQACSKVSVPKLEDLVASLAGPRQKGKERQRLDTELRGADLLKEEGTIYYLRESKA